MPETEDKDGANVEPEKADEATEKKAPEVSVKREGPCECSLFIDADEEMMKERYQESLDALQQEAAIPGFRPGKAPVALVARRFASRLKAEILSSALSDGYDKAVADNDLSVVADTDMPDIENMEWELGQPAHFEVKCEVLPDVEVTPEQYKGLSVEVPQLEVTDELMDGEVDRFVQRLARWESVEEGGVAAGDYVKAQITVPGESDEPVWEGELSFDPESGVLGPFEAQGLLDAMAGKAVGEAFEVDATVREGDAGNAVEAFRDKAGEAVKLTGSVLECHRRNVPELNDELATKLGMSSVEDIRSTLRTQLERDIEQQKKDATEFAVVKALLENVPFEMPSSLIQRATFEEQRRLQTRAMMSGMNAEQAQQIIMRNPSVAQDSALRKVKSSYVLRKIGDNESVYVTDEEIDEQIRAIAARERWSEARTKHYVEENDMDRSLRDEMRGERVLEKLIEWATITEIDPEEFQKRREAEREAEVASQAEKAADTGEQADESEADAQE